VIGFQVGFVMVARTPNLKHRVRRQSCKKAFSKGGSVGRKLCASKGCSCRGRRQNANSLSSAGIMLDKAKATVAFVQKRVKIPNKFSYKQRFESLVRRRKRVGIQSFFGGLRESI
jgi:hypothetical protein